ncbi:hypothetical protein AGMMS50229_19430 [Campylobacterota bacterium]|nr:hypothetical protein AGMMS50229_19430 [Campylobacterota bacterium]
MIITGTNGVGKSTIDLTDMSMHRIEQRAIQGGHSVRPEIVKENLELSIKHFETVAQKTDNIILYDNSNRMYTIVLDVRDKIIHFQADKMPEWSLPLYNVVRVMISTKNRGL